MTVTEDPFVTHRGLLFTVAYEMLGSASEAEDVVQDTWIRWDALGEAGRAEVQDSRAFLVRMVTRKALDRLRANARRREEYVGEWLPEPLLTAPDVAEDVELAESVSYAMLTVLETLTPTERAVTTSSPAALRYSVTLSENTSLPPRRPCFSHVSPREVVAVNNSPALSGRWYS